MKLLEDDILEIDDVVDQRVADDEIVGTDQLLGQRNLMLAKNVPLEACIRLLLVGHLQETLAAVNPMHIPKPLLPQELANIALTAPDVEDSSFDFVEGAEAVDELCADFRREPSVDVLIDIPCRD